MQTADAYAKSSKAATAFVCESRHALECSGDDNNKNLKRLVWRVDRAVTVVWCGLGGRRIEEGIREGCKQELALCM